MMRLSQLLKLREDLMRIDISKVEDAVKFVEVGTNSINFLEYDKTGIDKAYNALRDTLKVVRGEHRLLSDSLSQDIDRLREKYLDDCEQRQNEFYFSNVKHDREVRIMHFNPGIEDIIKARIGQYVSWETPGLEIGPGDGKWTKFLVAQDPLYLVDVNQEFLDSTAAKFDRVYQARLRRYLIKGVDLRELPKNQMGFVFSWNTFNYFTLGMIEQYLTEIKKVMRPGGVLMFSYNNCDLYKSVDMFERNFMTFVPSTELIKVSSRIGFELITCQNPDTHISWIELRNPGKLETNRAGQTLGKIIDKNA